MKACPINVGLNTCDGISLNWEATVDFILRVIAIIALASIGWFVLSKIDPPDGEALKTNIITIVVLLLVGAVLLFIKSFTG